MLVRGGVLLDDVDDLLFVVSCCWMHTGAVAVGCWLVCVCVCVCGGGYVMLVWRVGVG